MHSLLWTLSFLTVVPVPRSVHERTPAMAAVAFWFPLVGAGIGFLGAGVLAMLLRVLPAAIAAALTVAFMEALTRGLHLDGLADTFDGFFGGYTRERRLEIMKDTQMGTFGVAALALLLLVKTLVVAELAAIYMPWRDACVGLALALTAVVGLGRLAMVAAGAFNPYARRSGTGANFVSSLTPVHLLIALVVPAVGYGLAWRLPALAPFLAVAGLVAAASVLCRAKIGGMTGDTLGATGQLAELAVGLTLVIMAGVGAAPVPIP